MSINRVYSDKIQYHSAVHFSIELPGEQPDNETTCKVTKSPSIEEADEFAKVLWESKEEPTLQS